MFIVDGIEKPICVHHEINPAGRPKLDPPPPPRRDESSSDADSDVSEERRQRKEFLRQQYFAAQNQLNALRNKVMQEDTHGRKKKRCDVGEECDHDKIFDKFMNDNACYFCPLADVANATIPIIDIAVVFEEKKLLSKGWFSKSRGVAQVDGNSIITCPGAGKTSTTVTTTSSTKTVTKTTTTTSAPRSRRDGGGQDNAPPSDDDPDMRGIIDGLGGLDLDRCSYNHVYDKTSGAYRQCRNRPLPGYHLCRVHARQDGLRRQEESDGGHTPSVGDGFVHVEADDGHRGDGDRRPMRDGPNTLRCAFCRERQDPNNHLDILACDECGKSHCTRCSSGIPVICMACWEQQEEQDEIEEERRRGRRKR